MKIQIRFNTDAMKFPEKNLPPWRVLFDGKESLAREVNLSVKSWTSTDTLENGIVKHHVTCEGTPVWSGDSLSVL